MMGSLSHLIDHPKFAGKDPRAREAIGAKAEDAAPPVSWDDFYGYFGANWRQGEHVGLIGPTGSGKTTLAMWLLPLRKYVVVLGTKPRDKTLDELAARGYYKM